MALRPSRKTQLRPSFAEVIRKYQRPGKIPSVTIPEGLKEVLLEFGRNANLTELRKTLFWVSEFGYSNEDLGDTYVRKHISSHLSYFLDEIILSGMFNAYKRTLRQIHISEYIRYLELCVTTPPSARSKGLYSKTNHNNFFDQTQYLIKFLTDVQVFIPLETEDFGSD